MESANAPDLRFQSAKIVGRVLVLVGVAVVIGAVGIFCASEWLLKRVHDVPLSLTSEKIDSPNLVEGERLAKIVGCWAGCHGSIGQGGSIDMDGYYSVTAPTLSSMLPQYSDAELIRLIRFGIKRDGTTALGMTSYAFFPLSDEDLVDIIAHLRKQPQQQPVPRVRTIEWSARLTLAEGRWQVAADQIDPKWPRWGELPRTTAFERGRYLASITCSECHGVDFRGSEFKDNTTDGGPSLAIIAAYGPDEFRKLLRTGESIGDRDLGAMSWVAREGFTYFTDQEISDIRVFLRAHHGLEDSAPSH